jgi:hypothetical protein
MVRNAPAQLQNPQNPRAQGIQEKAGDFTADAESAEREGESMESDGTEPGRPVVADAGRNFYGRGD